MIKFRVVLAGVLSGVVLFLWLTIAHIFTPLGMVGVSELPTEKPVLEAMRENVPQSGFYFFPGMGSLMKGGKGPEHQAARQAYEAKYAAGPVGLLIYNTTGGAMMAPRQLVTELLNNLLQGLALAMILALLATHTVRSGAYVGFAAGLCAATATNVSYWNWYGFPANYTAAAIITEVVGYILMGIAGGWLLGRLARRVAA